MSMNYQDALTAQAAAEAKAQRDEQNARGWHAILNKYPLRDTQANYHIVLTWGNPITMESFEALLRRKSHGLDMASREQLIDDIIDKSYGDANALRQLRFRLGTYSLAQLRLKRGTIAFKEAVHTPDQARAYVASQRDKEVGWRNTGHPRLQTTIVPPGEYKPVPTGAYLRQLVKTDYYLWKRLVRMHGHQQIDWWMQNGQ